ncbi:serine/threonine-protein kinase HT1-like [Achlya hypogyna]|uniref:Serine/threonine-protein kinase HT1-like n=1 Tax=Achlya hypogyna TaxID=1202772 RepID=A0A1V9YZT0_ACHHY|nr:serine/threonine-protein kinase HT1-like [Achlya hypogyna]
MNVNDLIQEEIVPALGTVAVNNQMPHYEMRRPATNVVVHEPWQQIFLGEFYGALVQIHVISTEINRRILQSFASAVIMYRSLNFPYILMFQGAGWSTGDEAPAMYVIVPLIAHYVLGCSVMATEVTNAGCLHSLVEGNPYANPPRAPAPMPYERVIDILHDVASAMCFLHAQNPPVLHRNLRASSIHLTHDQTRTGGYSAKVGGFEWSRQLVDRYMTVMQGRVHLAPEMSNDDGAYSTAVDVYSFAMLGIEMISQGVVYPEFAAPNQAHRLAMAVMGGHRPAIPASCPAGLRNLIVRCWDSVPENRPSFPEILDLLDHRDTLLA